MTVLGKDGGISGYDVEPFTATLKLVFLNKIDYLRRLVSSGWTFDERKILREFDLNSLDFGPSINGRSHDKEFEFSKTKESNNCYESSQNIIDYIEGLFQECFARSSKNR